MNTDLTIQLCAVLVFNNDSQMVLVVLMVKKLLRDGHSKGHTMLPGGPDQGCYICGCVRRMCWLWLVLVSISVTQPDADTYLT